MKRRPIENSKVRKNVTEIIEEVPKGMRRYSLTLYSKYGSIERYPDVEYQFIIKMLKEYENTIILYQVTTSRTPRTFSLSFSVDEFL